jgi:hypothetical protein
VDYPPPFKHTPFPPVSTLEIRVLGGLNRGDNSLAEIFLEIFWWGGGEGSQKVKKNSPKIFRNRKKGGITGKNPAEIFGIRGSKLNFCKIM